MGKLKCPGRGCSFVSKETRVLLKKFYDGLPCPNCANDSLSYNYSQGAYKCYSCSELWSAVPCPICGTAIK